MSHSYESLSHVKFPHGGKPSVYFKLRNCEKAVATSAAGRSSEIQRVTSAQMILGYF